ncbi:MAG: hypothetical protein ACHP7E_08170 [Burkholderiales bacterium]
MVLGTLLLQGLTLKGLLRALDLHDGDSVAAEERSARERVLAAALAELPAGSSPAIDLARKEFKVRLGTAGHAGSGAFGDGYDASWRAGLRSARITQLALRDSGQIGDDAFHTLENELDWMEASDPCASRTPTRLERGGADRLYCRAPHAQRRAAPRRTPYKHIHLTAQAAL